MTTEGPGGEDRGAAVRHELLARLHRSLEMYADVPFVPVPRALLAEAVAALEGRSGVARPADIVLGEKRRTV